MTSRVTPVVYLSADAGRAYVVDDEKVFTFRAFDPELMPSTTAQLSNFFHFYSDITKVREPRPFSAARAELDGLTRRARCLNFVLEAIDIAASQNSRREAIRAANRLLRDSVTNEAIADILLNAPPPADADYEGALLLAKNEKYGNVQILCERIIESTAVIKRLRESWEELLPRLPYADLRSQAVEYASNIRLIGRVVNRGISKVLTDLHDASRGEEETLLEKVLNGWLKSQVPPDQQLSTAHGILCDDVKRVVYFFLDGQLGQAKTDRFLIHLSICPDCEQRVVLHRRLRMFVKKRLTRVDAPAQLKARLASCLPSLSQGVV